MNNKLIKLGLIGAGAWGSNFISTVKKVEGIEIISISTMSGKLNRRNLELDNFKIYKNWKDLVSEKDINGVIIATPADTHFEITKYCIQKGLPCIVEKPIATELCKAELIYEIAKKYKAIVLVDHIHLYHPAFEELKKLSKKAKNIITINSVAGGDGPFRKDIRALWDWGTHDIAMSIDIMGDGLKIIEASYLFKHNEGFKKGEIIQTKLLFDNQVQATLIFGNLMKGKNRTFEIKTDKSILKYQPLLKKKLIKISYLEDHIISTEIKTSELSAMEILIIKFRDLIQKKEEHLYDLKLALKVTSVIESISDLLV